MLRDNQSRITNCENTNTLNLGGTAANRLFNGSQKKGDRFIPSGVEKIYFDSCVSMEEETPSNNKN